MLIYIYIYIYICMAITLYMAIKCNSEYPQIPLNEMIEISSMEIVVRSICLKNNKYYLQAFLGGCLYKT